MQDEPPTAPTSTLVPSSGLREARADASWPGKAAFVLGLLSTAIYFATSLGIRHFAVFVVDAIRKALHAFGVAA